jgi:hypothetical protein
LTQFAYFDGVLPEEKSMGLGGLKESGDGSAGQLFSTKVSIFDGT